MSKGTMFDGGQSFDSISSRLIRVWLGVEALLTVISIILLFFLPGTAGGLLIIIFIAIILTLGVGGFLYIRYSSLAVVKNKRTYLAEQTRLLNKVSKITMELEKTEHELATNLTNENLEIERELQKIHKEYISNGLRAVKIDSGTIPGVGPKLKEKLKGVFGPVDFESSVREWEHSAYYAKEMGEGLKRKFIFFQNLISPEMISDIKLKTIELEKRYIYESGVK